MCCCSTTYLVSLEHSLEAAGHSVGSSVTMPENQVEKNAKEQDDDPISCINARTMAIKMKKLSCISDDNTETNIDNMIDIPIEFLPRLPKPDFDSIRRETIGGTFIVFLFIAIFVSLTHGVALAAVGRVPHGSVARIVLLTSIYTQAGIAVLCLLGIQFMNPGIVPRTIETCYPIPSTMREWVAANQQGPQSSYQREREHEPEKTPITSISPNFVALHRPPEWYIAGNDGRVYCTRCLVWRQPGINHFHCGTCQRCISYYDHHCTFFGRCIAGNLFHLGRRNGGNYAFFVGIILDGAIAYVTTAAALLYSLSLKYNPVYVIPIGVVTMILLPFRIMRQSPNRLCMMCRRCIVSIYEVLRR
jgi:hypothetical protein